MTAWQARRAPFHRVSRKREEEEEEGGRGMREKRREVK